MTNNFIAPQLPQASVTHQLLRPQETYDVEDFVDDGFDGGAFTAIGMPPDKAHLGEWTLVSLAENGIKSRILVLSCEKSSSTPTNSDCCFIYA